MSIDGKRASEEALPKKHWQAKRFASGTRLVPPPRRLDPALRRPPAEFKIRKTEITSLDWPLFIQDPHNYELSDKTSWDTVVDAVAFDFTGNDGRRRVVIWVVHEPDYENINYHYSVMKIQVDTWIPRTFDKWYIDLTKKPNSDGSMGSDPDIKYGGFFSILPSEPSFKDYVDVGSVVVYIER